MVWDAPDFQVPDSGQWVEIYRSASGIDKVLFFPPQRIITPSPKAQIQPRSLGKRVFECTLSDCRLKFPILKCKYIFFNTFWKNKMNLFWKMELKTEEGGCWIWISASSLEAQKLSTIYGIFKIKKKSHVKSNHAVKKKNVSFGEDHLIISKRLVDEKK